MSRVGETGVGKMGIGEMGVGEMGVGETGPNQMQVQYLEAASVLYLFTYRINYIYVSYSKLYKHTISYRHESLISCQGCKLFLQYKINTTYFQMLFFGETLSNPASIQIKQGFRCAFSVK